MNIKNFIPAVSNRRKRKMYKYKRVFTIVLDSLGIGDAKDAESYGDLGTNTLKHICDQYPQIEVPNLEGLGLGELGDFNGIYKLPGYFGTVGKLNEISNGKDTMTGHYELMGLKVEKPFKTFTETGFPDKFIKEFEEKTGYKTIGNIAASGTEIIDSFGEQQIKNKELIVYTSADSVFQIAAHEKYIGLDELYRCCEIARELLLKDEWKVGRVIARPFIGEKKGEFQRTSNRHDWALEPFDRTILNTLKDKGLDVIAVGKINDIFCGQGITEAMTTKSNEDGMDKTIALAKTNFTGLAFINLVDFDSMYGHRRDPIGYGKALERFDQQLNDLMYQLNEDDLLIITADHGNDPTFKGSDHTREQVPLILYSKKLKGNQNLGDLDSFATVGATIADNFDCSLPPIGKSILNEL